MLITNDIHKNISTKTKRHTKITLISALRLVLRQARYEHSRGGSRSAVFFLLIALAWFGLLLPNNTISAGWERWVCFQNLLSDHRTASASDELGSCRRQLNCELAFSALACHCVHTCTTLQMLILGELPMGKNLIRVSVLKLIPLQIISANNHIWYSYEYDLHDFVLNSNNSVDISTSTRIFK